MAPGVTSLNITMLAGHGRPRKKTAAIDMFNMVFFHSQYRFVFCTMLVLSLSAMAETDLPELPGSGLDIIEQNKYGEILAAADVVWSDYSKVQIERATVAFRERWIRDQRWRNGNTIREKDVIRIKSDMADLLHDVLSRELSDKGGYTVTDESGTGVMRITPRVVDLDIVAPDRVRDHIGYSLTDSQLSMSLELEVYDSLSGELLATSWQNRDDPYKGYMEWTTSVTNKRAARLMLERWSSWLIKGLEKAGARE